MNFLGCLFFLLFFSWIVGKVSDRSDGPEKEIVVSRHSPEELEEMDYTHLRNILKRVSSFHDPRPWKVIESFKKEGYDVLVCTDAGWGGRQISGVYSVWGKKPKEVK